jgi:hypothetical protein
MEVWLIAGIAVVAAVAVFALLNRRSGQVIDAPRQAVPPTSTPTKAPAAANEDQSAGDMLSAEGLDADDPLVYFADWLESEAAEELGTAAEQPGPTRRIADAARAAMPFILAQGRGVIDLPGLVVDATGGRDFRREIDIARLERAVADGGLLDVHELTDWRKDPPRVKALAAWLADKVVDDTPADAEMVEDDTVRIVEAARLAVADVDRTGRADIALPAIGMDDKGHPFDTRRTVDAQELQTIVTEFEENERVTTRTRTWGP